MINTVQVLLEHLGSNEVCAVELLQILVIEELEFIINLRVLLLLELLSDIFEERTPLWRIV